MSAVRVGLEVVGLMILAFAVAFAAGVVFLVPLFVFGYGIEVRPVVVAGLVATQLGFLAISVFFVRHRDMPLSLEVPSRRDWGYVAGGTVVSILLATVLSLVLSWLDLLPESVIEEMAVADPSILLILAVLSLVLIAPAEELFFRGAIQGRLRMYYGPFTAVAAASVVFGSLHLANFAGELVPVVAGAVLITIIGAVFGVLYEVTDNLTVPIIVHGVYNAVLLTISYISMVYI